VRLEGVLHEGSGWREAAPTGGSRSVDLAGPQLRHQSGTAVSEEVPGGKVAREIAGQLRINELRDAGVGSFNGRLRDELLSSEIFATLGKARRRIDRRRVHCNHRRVQRARGRNTPAASEATCQALPRGLEQAATLQRLSPGVDR